MHLSKIEEYDSTLIRCICHVLTAFHQAWHVEHGITF